MADTLTKLAYQSLQQGKSYFGFVHKTLSSRIKSWLLPAKNGSKGRPVPTEVTALMQQRLTDLLELDWQEAERGVYPTELLFDNPWDEFFAFYPVVWFDLPRIWGRSSQGQYQDFSPEIDTEGYPRYYLQNFHYQTDGYLSDLSANLYDLQVELLFNGAADAMRRRILAPLKQSILAAFKTTSPKQIRVLDVACGTGRTLRLIRSALPQTSLYGVDLSSAYLSKANQLLSKNAGELPQLIQANAEELPYRDNYFHGVTCVFLFHELPGPVRQHVIEQCFRVTQPGGVFVICDSLQVVDSPNLMPLMENFPIIFHEPYYRDYIQDDLVVRLEQAGFSDVQTENHFASKYWIAHKPA